MRMIITPYLGYNLTYYKVFAWVLSSESNNDSVTSDGYLS